MELVEIRLELTMDRCKGVNGAWLRNRQCLLCSSGEKAPPAQHHALRQSHVSPHAQLVWPRPQMTKEPLCRKTVTVSDPKKTTYFFCCAAFVGAQTVSKQVIEFGRHIIFCIQLSCNLSLWSGRAFK